MQFILVRIWRDNLPQYGRAITKPILCIVLTINFGANILSKNSLIHFSIKSRGWLFSYQTLFNVSTSCWNLKKPEYKLKHQNNKDIIKPIFYVSGAKLLKLVYTALKIFFRQALVAKFPFSRKMLASKKGNQQSFSFSKEKFMLGSLDEKHSWNLSAWSREENTVT